MSLWNLLFTPAQRSENDHFVNKLHQRLEKSFPAHSEKMKIVYACMAGLHARVAYVDFEIDKNERIELIKNLEKWGNLQVKEAEHIAEICFDYIEEFAGIDSRDLCTPLIEILSVDERYEILVSLFQMAASDGTVGQLEANEIRLISRGMLLEQKHFISAQATVLNYLGPLKS